MIKGFYVTPHLHGEKVSLAIYMQHDELKNNHTSLQRLNTTVSGRLGEWITLGGITQQGTDKETGTNRIYRMKKQNNQTVYLKVDRID